MEGSYSWLVRRCLPYLPPCLPASLPSYPKSHHHGPFFAPRFPLPQDQPSIATKRIGIFHGPYLTLHAYHLAFISADSLSRMVSYSRRLIFRALQHIQPFGFRDNWNSIASRCDSHNSILLNLPPQKHLQVHVNTGLCSRVKASAAHYCFCICFT